MDAEGDLPTLTGKLKVDWIDFPFDDILQQFTTLKEGILRGVFRQKAAAAWFGCRAEKAQITVLLPGGSDLSSWLDKVDCMSHSWPKSCNIGKMQVGKVHAKTFQFCLPSLKMSSRSTFVCINLKLFFHEIPFIIKLASAFCIVSRTGLTWHLRTET